MIYKDRQMMKWQGFVLSEHNEDMQYHNRKKLKPIVLDEQSIEIFNEMLLLSQERKSIVRIISLTFSDQFGEETISEGYVWKFDVINKGVWLRDKFGEKGDFVAIDSIQMIEEVDSSVI